MYLLMSILYMLSRVESKVDDLGSQCTPSTGRSEGHKGGRCLNPNVNGSIYSKRFTLDSC